MLTAAARASDEAEAVRVFRTFQGALFRSETATIRRLLTRKSRRFAYTMARQDLTGRKPLQMLGTTKVRQQLRVHVRDPNCGDRESFFVLVREDDVPQERIGAELAEAVANIAAVRSYTALAARPR